MVTGNVVPGIKAIFLVDGFPVTGSGPVRKNPKTSLKLEQT